MMNSRRQKLKLKPKLKFLKGDDLIDIRQCRGLKSSRKFIQSCNLIEAQKIVNDIAIAYGPLKGKNTGVYDFFEATKNIDTRYVDPSYINKIFHFAWVNISDSKIDLYNFSYNFHRFHYTY